jgi:hypothetical protein
MEREVLNVPADIFKAQPDSFDGYTSARNEANIRHLICNYLCTKRMRLSEIDYRRQKTDIIPFLKRPTY